MKVKRYRAENMAEAIAQVKRDLGLDAVILSTKTVRMGVKGLRKPILEVAATAPASAAKPTPSAGAVTASYQEVATTAPGRVPPPAPGNAPRQDIALPEPAFMRGEARAELADARRKPQPADAGAAAQHLLFDVDWSPTRRLHSGRRR